MDKNDPHETYEFTSEDKTKWRNLPNHIPHEEQPQGKRKCSRIERKDSLLSNEETPDRNQKKKRKFHFKQELITKREEKKKQLIDNENEKQKRKRKKHNSNLSNFELKKELEQLKKKLMMAKKEIKILKKQKKTLVANIEKLELDNSCSYLI